MGRATQSLVHLRGAGEASPATGPPCGVTGRCACSDVAFAGAGCADVPMNLYARPFYPLRLPNRMPRTVLILSYHGLKVWAGLTMNDKN